MATHGGTISWKAKELARTIVSGPIGGVIGAKYLGETLGYKNIACSDIGGTSFDVALITQGELTIRNDPDMARLVLSLPLVAMDSVGAGAGSFVRIDPYTKTMKLGPDSAGYRVGVCWKEGGIETVTVSDCHVVLGYLNPDNFLGGKLKLDVEQRTIDAIKTQIADPLRLSVEDAAAGVIELLDSELRRLSAVDDLGQGLQPAEFRLLLLRRRRPGACLRIHRRAGLRGRDRPGVGRGLLGLWLRGCRLRVPLRQESRHRPRPGCRQGAADRGGEGGAGGMGGADEERLGGVPDQRLQPEAGAAAARLSDAVPRPAQ